jgi:hypothetical protein
MEPTNRAGRFRERHGSERTRPPATGRFRGSSPGAPASDSAPGPSRGQDEAPRVGRRRRSARRRRPGVPSAGARPGSQSVATSQTPAQTGPAQRIQSVENAFLEAPAVSVGGAKRSCSPSRRGGLEPAAQPLAGSKSSAKEFMQKRRPVGRGPSLNTCPRWLPQRRQRTSVRTMPWLASSTSSTASATAGS